MELLIDTHILLWWLDDHPRLREKHRKAISSAENICFISSATVWEISVKSSIGKLKIPGSYLDVLKKQGFREIPISCEHADKVRDLPFHHRDPFDRLLIAQALIEDLTILTEDTFFPLYGVRSIGP